MYEERIHLRTKGELDVIDITDDVERIVKRSGIKHGICLVFVPGSTGGIILNENETSLMSDFKSTVKRLIKDVGYEHPVNARSHLRAMLFGCEKVLPIANGRLETGTWQQLMFVEFDTRAREREVIVIVIGE